MKINNKRLHIDGSSCLEGTCKIPKRYNPCCKCFNDHTKTCEYDIRYEWWSKQKIWVIAIPKSAGGGGIKITFCPHCGKKLNEKK